MIKYFSVAFFVLAIVTAHAEDPAVEERYQQAIALRDQGNFSAAIEKVGQAVALNSLDQDLFAKCEMLSAELYVKLNMLDSAATTARQVQMLYAGTDYEKQAAELSEKIEQLMEQSGKSK